MDQLDDILCVIPARGGSKGVFRKNERMLGGKPLVSHSIDHAIRAGLPRANIVLSTDDDAIMDIGKKHGIALRRRPDEISGDFDSTESALIDALDTHATRPNHVMLLQPTSPIRFKSTIPTCLISYLTGQFDSLITTTKFHDFFWRETPAVYRDVNEPIRWKWKASYSPQKRPMRQDLKRDEFLYYDNGNLYITNAEVLRETHCRIGDNPCVYPISELEGMQIDTIADMNAMHAIFSGSVGEL